ncbi:hypothetical protein ACVKN2_001745 [Paenibacillus sp. PvR018]|nr:hypothetical protein [Paenibacillus sp. PvP091]MBP1170289.1 hypothetical protein [Paenibacillus sp. PvR098]MBP2441317.1 hypothetical protein [Paenibacillus sp. PvP052]
MAEDEERLCVRCQYVNGKHQFCIKCGAPLVNRCTDEPGRLHKGCGKVNPADAAFCQSCGQSTTFYKAGLIQAYLDS